MTNGRYFRLLVSNRVVDRPGGSIERLAAARPDIHEVGGNEPSIRIDDPAALNERSCKIGELRHTKRKTDQLDPVAQAIRRHRPLAACLIVCGTRRSLLNAC